MNGENWLLVTDEPIEFEKWLVEVQDFMTITDHFRGIYIINPNLIKKNWKMSTVQPVGLENTTISNEYAQNPPWTLDKFVVCWCNNSNIVKGAPKH